MKRALAAMEEVLGAEHADLIICLESLAELYTSPGPQSDPDRAVHFSERALAIMEKVLGPDHLDLVPYLERLARLRRPWEGESLLERALAMRENVLGPRHPDVVASLEKLASNYEARSARIQQEQGLHAKLEQIGRAHV